ncbi:MAG: TATA-box-binding protein [Candidatus Thorarchaeota archaeon]
MVLEAESNGNHSSLTYSIQNIVIKSSLNIKKNIDLILLSKALNNSKYDSNRFPGLFTRFNRPKCVIIIFSNGKLVLTGLKSSDFIDLIINRLVLKLNKIIPIDITSAIKATHIVNIVVTANFYKEINLDATALLLDNIIYEPEVFPGLIYHSQKPVKSVFLVFSTGKVVLTGIREEKVIEPVLVNLGRLLKNKKLFKGLK